MISSVGSRDFLIFFKKNFETIFIAKNLLAIFSLITKFVQKAFHRFFYPLEVCTKLSNKVIDISSWRFNRIWFHCFCLEMAKGIFRWHQKQQRITITRWRCIWNVCRVFWNVIDRSLSFHSSMQNTWRGVRKKV